MANKNAGRGFKAAKNFEPGRAQKSSGGPKRRFVDRDDSASQGGRKPRRDNDNRGGYERRDNDSRGGSNERRDNDNRGGNQSRDNANRGAGSERRSFDRKDSERGGYQRRDSSGRGGGYERRDNDSRGGSNERRDSDNRGGGSERRNFDRKDTERGSYERRDNNRGGPQRRGDDTRGGRGARDDRRTFDRKDNERGGYQRRDNDNRGGGNERRSFDRKDNERGGYQRRENDRGGYQRREASGGKRDFYVAEEDIVLDRITAKKTTAEDVAGMTFAGLGLGGNIVNALAKLGADTPFPIQGATIPDVLKGLNVLGRGRTGSGKTIAFGAPLVERLLQMKGEGKFAGDPATVHSSNNRSRRDQSRGRKPKAMILAPTRELALQLDRTIQPIARSVGLYTTQIYGGVPQTRQVSSLHMGVDIVIGTPGRMQDLIKQGHLDLSEVVISVLDEADHMCDLGFLEPVQHLLRETVSGGQKLLFSATLDAGVATLVGEFLPQHEAHEVAGEDQASGTIDHQVLVVLREDKLDVLLQLVRRPGRILLFTRTRAFAEQLNDLFNAEGIPTVALHGDLNQARRARNLKQFSSGRVDVLVATDVAARGIHIDDVDLVVQADAPDDYKSYMHRAGRTGRAGNQGTVATVIPRNRQRRTEELMERAEIVPSFFDIFRPNQEFMMVEPKDPKAK